MLLNAYDTTVGKVYSATEQIKGTIRTLALMNDLTSSPKENVYFIDHETSDRLPLFTFPLSIQSHDRKFITVLDRRPFFSKKGVLTNAPEYSEALVAAYLQQDVQERSFVPLRSSMNLTTRGYARAIANRIARAHGLEPRETIELTVFLAHFYVCQFESSLDDVQFVSLNVLWGALNVDRSITLPLVEEMGYINRLEPLVKFLSERDGFYKLRTLTTTSFVRMASTIWFSQLGTYIMGAALELPTLFTGICYATVCNNMYAKTTLGAQLDPRMNEDAINAFKKSMQTNYPLGK